eukprot:Selendium_serpulae@DN5585_c0_g2_i1.p1
MDDRDAKVPDLGTVSDPERLTAEPTDVPTSIPTALSDPVPLAQPPASLDIDPTDNSSPNRRQATCCPQSEDNNTNGSVQNQLVAQDSPPTDLAARSGVVTAAFADDCISEFVHSCLFPSVYLIDCIVICLSCCFDDIED